MCVRLCILPQVQSDLYITTTTFFSYSCLSLFSSVPIPPSYPHFLFPFFLPILISCSHSSFLFSFFCSHSHSSPHTLILSLSNPALPLVPLALFSRHAMNSAGILLYAFTSCVAGYVSTRLYHKMNGDNWVWKVILTASMLAGKS